MNTSGNIGVRVPIRRLVKDHPEKAVDILVRCCQDADIQNEILFYLLDPDLKSSGTPVEVSESANPTNARHTTSALDSERATLPLGRRRPSDRSARASRLPPSPTRTASSYSRSLASKDGKECIIFLTAVDERPEEHLAQMRNAQIELSVISEHMFDEGRICESHITSVPRQVISVPRPGLPGSFLNVSVSSCAKLTWKRPGSRTHSTTFYLVPPDMLDIDVLLGCEDSGEGMHSLPLVWFICLGTHVNNVFRL